MRGGIESTGGCHLTFLHGIDLDWEMWPIDGVWSTKTSLFE